MKPSLRLATTVLFLVLDNASGEGCAKDEKLCPDGSRVARKLPSCEFTECPEASPIVLAEKKDDKATAKSGGFTHCMLRDFRTCPDGTVVQRVPPTCELPACPKPNTVNQKTSKDSCVLRDAMTCPDGTFVTRTPPLCELKCPQSKKKPVPPTSNNQSDPEPKPKPAPTKASGSGDPHFKTWSGDKFDYHGECDLVLVDNPTFANGLGLRVHIRTTKVKYFSFIEKVAVQIGEDTLEFDNDVETFLINGAVVEKNHKHHKTHLGGFFVRRDARAISVRLSDEKKGGPKIDLHTRRNGFPAVIVDGGNTDIFKGSLGLLGEWKTGRRLARNGKTEMNGHDATAFALEWQVKDTEPMLFAEARFPQYPTTCTPPAKRVHGKLGSSSFEKEAEKACAHWKEDQEDCIFDVVATRDTLVALESHIVHMS